MAERDKVDKQLDHYVNQCLRMKVWRVLLIPVNSLSQDGFGLLLTAVFYLELQLIDSFFFIVCIFQMKCEKLVIENENVVDGLVELINLHGVTKLVISAAPDRNYSR